MSSVSLQAEAVADSLEATVENALAQGENRGAGAEIEMLPRPARDALGRLKRPLAAARQSGQPTSSPHVHHNERRLAVAGLTRARV